MPYHCAYTYVAVHDDVGRTPGAPRACVGGGRQRSRVVRLTAVRTAAPGTRGGQSAAESESLAVAMHTHTV